MKPVVLISFAATDATLEQARAKFETCGTGTEAIDRDALIEMANAKKADALLIGFQNKFDAAAIAKLPAKLKVLATCSVGFDHIDVQAARAKGFVVTNTPDVLTRATADLAMLLMLGALRRQPEQRELLDDGWGRALGQNEMLGREVSGRTLGILGMGRIGQAVADRALGFGMKILYSNRRRLPPAEEKGATYFKNFEEMLPHCEILSLHAPGGKETDDIMNAHRFGLLPQNAVFVNVARGSLVDENALLQALERGHLFAAGLDVYKNEPNPDPRLLKHPRIMATPHTGSSTRETRDAMGLLAIANIHDVLTGKPARSEVRPK